MPERRSRQIAFHNTVRVRLLLIALLPIMILLPLVLMTTVRNWSHRFDEVLIAKVSGELTVAHQHLAGLMQARGDAISALAQSAAYRDLHTDKAELRAFLEQERIRMGLDFLYAIDTDGVIIFADADRTLPDQREWPVVRAALSGTASTEIDVFSATQLESISPTLARLARLKLVPTKAASPTERIEEPRGMMVHTAAPAPDGALVGGLLLNRNLGFIDEINALVYPEGSLTGGNLGTATLFLDDVRVSTNVRLFEGTRALGTRVSQEVRDKVLGDGLKWTARAFVVNDWYISAYEPVIDSFGERIGMLYVGFLEQPFQVARQRTLMWVWGGFFVIMAISVPVLLSFARGIFRPLENMNRVISKVERGNLSARSDVTSQSDEISRLATHLDNLLDQVQERDRRLRDWAEELENRVEKRTRDLQEANKQLEVTSKQLILSEKLAAVGEITAGVAHEINNPLAVIQGNLDIVIQDLGPNAAPMQTELSLIQEQIHKISVLVTKVLRFTRPEEFEQGEEGLDPDAVVRATLPLVQHILTSSGIEIDLDLNAGCEVQMNETELQQVLVNLMVNAIQAMPDGGTLSVRTERIERDGRARLRMTIADTGQGMSEEVRARIFDPFYTTKRSEGTGLGLSITRDLIQRAGGDISVESSPGMGAHFTIYLPAIA